MFERAMTTHSYINIVLMVKYIKLTSVIGKCIPGIKFIDTSIVHHEDMTSFGRGVCNEGSLHIWPLSIFPPYLVKWRQI